MAILRLLSFLAFASTLPPPTTALKIPGLGSPPATPRPKVSPPPNFAPPEPKPLQVTGDLVSVLTGSAALALRLAS